MSGSGKSSLINETLWKATANLVNGNIRTTGKFKEIRGVRENVDKVIQINQRPIGRTPRSNPATYTGVWDQIRKLFAELPESREFEKMFRSASHLAEHFEGYPLLLFGFVQADPTGSSIYPALWSAMLAARAEGVGAALTTVFLFKLDELTSLLGVPKDQGWNFAGCVTFGYPTGPWRVAPRRPAHEVAFRNGWGKPVGFEIPEPLWKALP